MEKGGFPASYVRLPKCKTSNWNRPFQKEIHLNQPSTSRGFLLLVSGRVTSSTARPEMDIVGWFEWYVLDVERLKLIMLLSTNSTNCQSIQSCLIFEKLTLTISYPRWCFQPIWEKYIINFKDWSYKCFKAYLSMYLSVHSINGHLQISIKCPQKMVSPRKLQHTPISHTRQRQSPGNANYERNPGWNRLLVKVATGVCSSSVCWNNLRVKDCQWMASVIA